MVLPDGDGVLFDGYNLSFYLVLQGMGLVDVAPPSKRYVRLSAKKNHRRRTPMV